MRRAEQPRNRGSSTGRGQEISSSHIPRTTLGLTQPPIQRLSEVFSPAYKRPGREAEPSPARSAEIKNAWNCPSTYLYTLMAKRLIKHKDNFRLHT